MKTTSKTFLAMFSIILISYHAVNADLPNCTWNAGHTRPTQDEPSEWDIECLPDSDFLGEAECLHDDWCAKHYGSGGSAFDYKVYLEYPNLPDSNEDYTCAGSNGQYFCQEVRRILVGVQDDIDKHIKDLISLKETKMKFIDTLKGLVVPEDKKTRHKKSMDKTLELLHNIEEKLKELDEERRRRLRFLDSKK